MIRYLILLAIIIQSCTLLKSTSEDVIYIKYPHDINQLFSDYISNDTIPGFKHENQVYYVSMDHDYIKSEGKFHTVCISKTRIDQKNNTLYDHVTKSPYYVKLEDRLIPVIHEDFDEFRHYLEYPVSLTVTSGRDSYVIKFNKEEILCHGYFNCYLKDE